MIENLARSSVTRSAAYRLERSFRFLGDPDTKEEKLPRELFSNKIYKMVKFVVFVVCLVAIVAVLTPSPADAHSLREIISKVKQKGERALSAITTPIQKAVITRLLEKCNSLKKILGVTYEKLVYKEAEADADVNLDIWNGEQKTTYNINDAEGRATAAKMIDPRLPVAIFLHGFLSSSDSEAALEVTKALVTRGGLNVLALDASDFIEKYYVRSATCVRFIGEDLGKLMVQFVKYGIPASRIHIIGHSLGSHIAGFAGKTFNKLVNGAFKIGRISGLDPAGPCFFKEQDDLRLKNTDADFVDVIHTDAGILGIIEPLGHVDFFPNGGEKQPGCVVPPCSHSLAWRLFSESIVTPHSFEAVQCYTWDAFKHGSCDGGDLAPMGYGAPANISGSYYLETRGDRPYGMGPLRTRIHSRLGKIGKAISRVFKRHFHRDC